MIVVKSEGVEIECIFDNVFDSMNISFNVNRPVDNKSDMENRLLHKNKKTERIGKCVKMAKILYF